MSKQINNEMITLARESRGLTQGALAKASGVTQSNISRYESGLVAVPEEMLNRLSTALRYPIAFFQQEDQRRPSDLFYRKRKGLASGLLRKTEARMNIVRMHFERLLRNVDLEVGNTFDCGDPHDINVSPVELATRFRYVWGVPMGPVNNLVALIEAAGGIVVPFPFETPRIDAVSIRGDYNPIFFVNMRVPGDRLRFTLAHELGHVLMHQIPGPEDEQEANAFASAFLLPEDALRPDIRPPVTIRTLAALKAKWLVSMQALVMRARDISRISESAKKRLFIRMSQLGYRKKEPVPIPPEQPMLYRRLIDFHLSELQFSPDELCGLLNLIDERELNYYYYPEKLRLRIVESGMSVVSQQRSTTDRVWKGTSNGEDTDAR